MRVNIFVRDEDLSEIDRYCNEAGFKRSNLMVSSTMQRIKGGESVYKVEAKRMDVPPQEIKLCKHGRMFGLCEKGCK
jgi:hypothetical protein